MRRRLLNQKVLKEPTFYSIGWMGLKKTYLTNTGHTDEVFGAASAVFLNGGQLQLTDSDATNICGQHLGLWKEGEVAIKNETEFHWALYGGENGLMLTHSSFTYDGKPWKMWSFWPAKDIPEICGKLSEIPSTNYGGAAVNTIPNDLYPMWKQSDANILKDILGQDGDCAVTEIHMTPVSEMPESLKQDVPWRFKSDCQTMIFSDLNHFSLDQFFTNVDDLVRLKDTLQTYNIPSCITIDWENRTVTFDTTQFAEPTKITWWMITSDRVAQYYNRSIYKYITVHPLDHANSGGSN